MRAISLVGVAGMMAATVAGLGIPKSGLARRQAANDNIVYISDLATYCILLPRTPYTGIGTSEAPGGTQTYCSANGRFDTNLQGVLPDNFWSNPELLTTPGINGARMIQMLGCFNPGASSQLDPTDGGGQYDSSGGDDGLGNPQGSACLGYNHYVELLEPVGRRACIRCCDDPADCPVSLDTLGCQGLMPGNYFGCTD